jgi:PAS domain S-box-containing protein
MTERNKNAQPAILIVEDDYSSSIMLKGMLESSGYRIIDIISSGEEAVTRAVKLAPDLILMDITLKGAMDGIEACAEIKKARNIPVIYLTVSAEDDILQRAKKTEPYGYILKPYNKHILHSTLAMALHKIEAEKKLRESERRNREILDAIPDRVFRIMDDGSFVDEGDARTGKAVWSDRVARKAAQHIARLTSSGEPQVFEYSLRKDRHVEHFEARLVPSVSKQALVMVRDVTYRKISEIELEHYRTNLEDLVNRRTAELSDLNRELQGEINVRNTIERNLNIFSHAISQSPSVIVIMNSDGLIEYVNSRYTEISGREFDDMIGRRVTQQGIGIIPEAELWQNIQKQDSWRGELYNLNARGELIYLDARISAIRDDGGSAVHYVLIADDITESKKDRDALSGIQEALKKKREEAEEVELDWQEWKDKMMSRNISRTDKSLFRNINKSFPQGAGFGALITLFAMMSSSAKRDDGKCIVDGGLYDMITKNVRIAQDAFKTFSTIDWIISNDFTLEKISFYDLHRIVKAVVARVGEFAGIKNQRIVLSEYSPVFGSFMVNVNREYIFAALSELLINAMKLSKNQTAVAVLLSVVNSKVSLSVINEPERSDEGITGIPLE